MKLGFSLYPEQGKLADLLAYIQQFPEDVVDRVFLSLLQIDPTSQETRALYKQVIAACNQQGFRVFADLSPQLIEDLGWQEDLLEQVRDFGLSGLRLDEAYEPELIQELLENPYGLKIELNASVGVALLEKLQSLGANLSNLTACHNFYPRRLTGLSTKRYHELSQVYREAGVELVAFISSQTATQGPWIYEESLPTLEEHRGRSLLSQAKWYLADGKMDYLLLSNQMIDPSELKPLLELLQGNQEIIHFQMETIADLLAVEKDILDYEHFYRPDVSDYLVRSTMTRIDYAHQENPYRPGSRLGKRGDIMLNNDLAGRYKNECSILLCPVELDHTSNIVGHITDEDLPLLDFLQPGQAFRLERIQRE